MNAPRAHDYNHAGVTDAVNPSAFGYHHGPIVNNNPGWVPANVLAARNNGFRDPQVTAADNENDDRSQGVPPNLGETMCTLNTGVCDIDTGNGVLCGIVFSGAQTQCALRRHARNVHPGALRNPGRGNVKQAMQLAGSNAIKLFVRSGAWRDMPYLNEPGRGPLGGWLDIYATEMEAIAAVDPAFADAFGTRFHRSISLRNQRKLGWRSADDALAPMSQSEANARTGHAHAEHMLANSSQTRPVGTPKSASKRKRSPEPPADEIRRPHPPPAPVAAIAAQLDQPRDRRRRRSF